MLTGGEAIARGIYQGVAQLADRTYWKNRALGMVEAVKFIGSLMAEDVWLESWETEYRTAVVTGNQKTCDQLLERFEKHEFQPLSSAEQGIRQTCIQLQTLSWDQLVEHGALLATSLALDCVILKAGEFALSPASRTSMSNWIHDITETLKLPKAQAQEHMIEFAGIGKIALEESSEVATAVVKSIQKNPEVLAQESKTTAQVIRETAQEIISAQHGGKKPILNAAQQRGAEFEEFLVKKLGGKGSFKVRDKLAGTREFDGAVGNVWYEAKSGEYWNMLQENSQKMSDFTTDMGKGLKITKKNGVNYALYSNTPIPQKIKNWLTKKGIHFKE